MLRTVHITVMLHIVVKFLIKQRLRYVLGLDNSNNSPFRNWGYVWLGSFETNFADQLLFGTILSKEVLRHIQHSTKTSGHVTGHRKSIIVVNPP